MRIKFKKSLAAIITTVSVLLSPVQISALSISSVLPPKSSTSGGEEVTIKGEFNQAIKFKKVVSGALNAIGVTEDGLVYTWGRNYTYGVLGDGSTDDFIRNAPEKPLEGLLKGKKIVDAAAGTYHNIVVDDEGNIYGWGRNTDGQLGIGSGINISTTPASVDLSSVGRPKIISLTTGLLFSEALDENGKVYSWGKNDVGQLGLGHTSTQEYFPQIANIGTEKIEKISSSYNFTLAITENGKILAWGINNAGQLGIPTATASYLSVPTLVDSSAELSGSTVTEIMAGGAHSLALTSDNKVFAWGANNHGQLGNGGWVWNHVPIKVDTSDVSDGSKFISISAGIYTSFILDANGNIYSFGQGANGQLGNGLVDTQPSPVKVFLDGELSGKKVTKIWGNSEANHAIDESGKAYSWGRNDRGIIGDGSEAKPFAYADEPRSVIIPEIKITSIKFGDIKVSDFEFIDDNTIKVISPPHAAGFVDIVIENSLGDFVEFSDYEYFEENTVEIETPNTGVGK